MMLDSMQGHCLLPGMPRLREVDAGRRMWARLRATAVTRALVGSGFVLLAALPALQAQSSSDGIDFFERKIRPLFAENCYACHSAATNAMSDLRLDSRAGVLNGGSRGPAVAPGQPNTSLLLRAVSYTDLDLRMPPTGKLSDEKIAALREWIRIGAPDPRVEEPPPDDPTKGTGIDIQAGRQFWSFQPLLDPPVPPVRQAEWVTSQIDAFLLRALEDKSLTPARPADKRTLLRRATFDLTGLPPVPREINDFVADNSPDAFKTVVERLLASPHYGERWARHWLDLVRFAETNGHEFDNDKLDAYRYRDYVIRAFNDDLPYDQFIKEHIAGDLLATPRTADDGGFWESPLGTGFYWFGEVLNSATDSVKARADEVDNQIDVMSKALLGLTVACARCHDHKFDPIPTIDYYALAGILHSTDLSETSIDSPSRVREIEEVHEQITKTNKQITALLQAAKSKQAARLQDSLLAAAEFLYVSAFDGAPTVEEWAKEQDREASRLTAWVKYLQEARTAKDHVFYPFAVLAEKAAGVDPGHFAEQTAAVREELHKLARLEPLQDGRGDLIYEDFEKKDYDGWRAAGRAFGDAPSREASPNQALRGHDGRGLASSFRGGSDALVGTLTSDKFEMPKLYLHVRIAGTRDDRRLGEEARLRLTLVADAHKSQHIVPSGSGAFEWQTVRLTKEIGRICYFEIVDRSREGHIAIDKIVLSDSKEPPAVTISPRQVAAPNRHVMALLERTGAQSIEAFATAYQRLFEQVTASNSTSREDRWLLAALSPSGKLEAAADLLGADEQLQLSRLQQRRDALHGQIPASSFAMASRDGRPHNVALHIRGSHKNLGEPVPRGFLQVIAGEHQPPMANGSGRLQLAEAIVSEGQSLLARVMVNRIWKHHFGDGIVRSPDNFGQTGERPTHPELLDYLAKRFIESGWSVRAMHRLMLLSSAYRMSSRAHPSAAEIDPENKLLHHMPVRRLEGEVIRDSILAVAGTLDDTLYGPSVTPHISEYQDGRGKPESGPLDANGRRSLYIQVRRNFLPPMFLAFDYPLPISTIGRRSVSTVASQPLLMMNNVFVARQAEHWAQRLRSVETDNRKRIKKMFLQAFGRPAEDWEIREAMSFLGEQQKRYGLGHDADEPRAWNDLAHVLLNSTEFIFVR